MPAELEAIVRQHNAAGFYRYYYDSNLLYLGLINISLITGTCFTVCYKVLKLSIADFALNCEIDDLLPVINNYKKKKKRP